MRCEGRMGVGTYRCELLAGHAGRCGKWVNPGLVPVEITVKVNRDVALAVLVESSEDDLRRLLAAIRVYAGGGCTCARRGCEHDREAETALLYAALRRKEV